MCDQNENRKAVVLNTSTLTEENSREFIGQIVCVVEDKFAELELEIENEDREEAIADGEDPEELAIIYGMDYDLIGGPVEFVLEQEAYTAEEIANGVMDAIQEDFVDTGKISPLDEEDLTDIRENILTVCERWGICSSKSGE